MLGYSRIWPKIDWNGVCVDDPNMVGTDQAFMLMMTNSLKSVFGEWMFSDLEAILRFTNQPSIRAAYSVIKTFFTNPSCCSYGCINILSLLIKMRFSGPTAVITAKYFRNH
eukprot:TRINITY_DN10247_c1_g1_i1.p1 TRINITY_DN10247_c1_g1~~TRINITY_DN10247_c1_g1_i1.p1  ORF type:complete len:111 (+),score=4.86 TRINITY_DN10247_c1_g1_i1:67-399(+)